jgi:hypothetical protein
VGGGGGGELAVEAAGAEDDESLGGADMSVDPEEDDVSAVLDDPESS